MSPRPPESPDFLARWPILLGLSVRLGYRPCVKPVDYAELYPHRMPIRQRGEDDEDRGGGDKGEEGRDNKDGGEEERDSKDRHEGQGGDDLAERMLYPAISSYLPLAVPRDVCLFSRPAVGNALSQSQLGTQRAF